MEVRLEHMMPAEIGAAREACPTLFLPLGTIEWHGVHSVAGVDALKAHELCARAAQRGGGVVHPPLYGGVGGLDEPHTFIFDPEDSAGSVYLRPWLEQWCREAKRNGYKAVVIVTGHYGAAQQICVREAAVRMTTLLDIPVLGTPEYWLALDEQYYGDHAAFFETSIMMHLFPESVDLSRLGDEPHRGVGGRDPKKCATAAEGERFCEAIIRRLASLARTMHAWDAGQRRAFARAEGALVRRQMELAGETGNIWAGWRRIGEGVLDGYPAALTDARFDDVAAIAEKL